MHLAANGADGLAAAKRGVYVAILTDGHMPVMNGWDMTREIRRHERECANQCGIKDVLVANDVCESGRCTNQCENLNGLDQEAVCYAPRYIQSTTSASAKAPAVIIGVTGTAGAEEVRLCHECGMTDVLTKPVDRACLARTIHRWIGANSESGSGAPAGGPFSSSECQEKVVTSSSTEAPTVRRVLLSVSDASQRVFIRGLLSSYRAAVAVEVVIAQDGAAARRVLQSEAATGMGFDAVVLDLDLPGPVLASEVLSSAKEMALVTGRPRPVLLALRGRPKSEPTEAGPAAAGFDLVLDRPLRAAAFHAALRQRLMSCIQRLCFPRACCAKGQTRVHAWLRIAHDRTAYGRAAVNACFVEDAAHQIVDGRINIIRPQK